MLTTQFRAVAQCDHEWTEDGRERGCVHTEYFTEDAGHCSLDEFNRKAQDHFYGRGWQFVGGTKCPDCARGVRS